MKCQRRKDADVVLSCNGNGYKRSIVTYRYSGCISGTCLRRYCEAARLRTYCHCWCCGTRWQVEGCGNRRRVHCRWLCGVGEVDHVVNLQPRRGAVKSRCLTERIRRLSDIDPDRGRAQPLKLEWNGVVDGWSDWAEERRRIWSGRQSRCRQGDAEPWKYRVDQQARLPVVILERGIGVI